MKVSAKAEYACIAMLELALNYGEPQPLRVKAIADAHGIPQRFLVQILLQLKGAGLVVSLRGAAGGYQLARPPREIRLADIVNLIDRPAPARSGGPTLSASRAMEALREVWRRIQAQEQRLLEEITLADLISTMQQSSAPSYQI
jgi:Rrf2 family cysteine metabolism transcriptional repressor